MRIDERMNQRSVLYTDAFRISHSIVPQVILVSLASCYKREVDVFPRGLRSGSMRLY